MASKDPLLRGVIEQFDSLLAQFGHFSESGNDFSSTPWQEDPDFLFRLINRQAKGEKDSMKRSGTLTSESRGIPKRSYRRAGRFRLYREMISSEYTRCYGLFRELFLMTGHFFEEKTWLEDSKDVFYLTLDQHNRMMEGVGEEEAKRIKIEVDRVKKETDVGGRSIYFVSDRDGWLNLFRFDLANGSPAVHPRERVGRALGELDDRGRSSTSSTARSSATTRRPARPGARRSAFPTTA